MPKKWNSDKDHGQKIIQLFFKLFFSPYEYSLTELAKELECSKQTVGRIVEKINSSLKGIKIEDILRDNRRYFKIKKEKMPPNVMNLTQSEYGLLQMCCAFTKHLIGNQMFSQAVQALNKSQVLINDHSTVSERHFGAFKPGTIDYSSHQKTLKDLIVSMENKKVCKIIYQALWNQKQTELYIKPLKLFSKGDTIYLHTKLAKKPGNIYKEPDYDPLLVVHRIQALEITQMSFEMPVKFDFEKAYNQTFGVIKEEAFQIKVEFTGFAARYVKERSWSHDQEIVEKGNGKIELTFTATSEAEALSWILSYGYEARALEPGWFVKSIITSINNVLKIY